MKSSTSISTQTGINTASTGKERDAETGYGYFGARYMDHEVMSGWLSVDPMADKYPGMSPYNYCAWNPMRLVDPDGNECGDYYSHSGKYLGSDGRQDNKVYVVNKNESTSTSYENAKDLNITHEQFCTIANIVKQESSHAQNEDLWIAHTANNAAKQAGKSLYNQLKSSYSSVRDKGPLSSSDGSSYANSARASVIHVLTGEPDPTGGATLWDGTDFLAWGTSQNKFKEYKKISISKAIFDTYSGNNTYPSGVVKYGTKRYEIPAKVFKDPNNWNNNTFQYTTNAQKATKSIEATGAVGKSIFWKTVK